MNNLFKKNQYIELRIKMKTKVIKNHDIHANDYEISLPFTQKQIQSYIVGLVIIIILFLTFIVFRIFRRIPLVYVLFFGFLGFTLLIPTPNYVCKICFEKFKKQKHLFLHSLVCNIQTRQMEELNKNVREKIERLEDDLNKNKELIKSLITEKDSSSTTQTQTDFGNDIKIEIETFVNSTDTKEDIDENNDSEFRIELDEFDQITSNNEDEIVLDFPPFVL